MNSTSQMTDNNFKKSCSDKKENKVRGLSTIYNMNSTAQMALKQTDTNLLDTIVPDINVPIMELSRKKTFNMEKWINKTVTKISNKIKQKSMQIANWIFNTKIVKYQALAKAKSLPSKIKDLIKLVMKSKYSDVEISHNYEKEKLSVKRSTAFKNSAIVYKMKVLDSKDPLNQMMLLNTRKTYLLDKRLNLLKGIKCNETLEIKFEKLGSEGKMIEKSFTFTSRPEVITNKNDIESALQNMRSEIEDRIDRFTMEGSGWAVIGVLNHDLHVNKYDPLAARSYIKLPAEIQNRLATINIQNADDKCFIYCLGRALDPNPEPSKLERVSSHLKNVCETLGLSNIKTPVNVQDLPNIERQFNVSINLYGHSELIKNPTDSYMKPIQIYPIHITQSTAAKHIDLLVTSNTETNHYVWIKNFNKLCAGVTKNTAKKFFCKHCIQHFPSEDRLEKHMMDCIVLTKCQAIQMPAEGEVIKFKSFRETVKIPFVIYADLESILQKLTVTQKEEMEQEQTEKLQKHVACSYGYKVVCCYDEKLSKPFKMYRGLDIVNKFFTDIFEEEEEILEKLNKFQNTPMYMSNEENMHHKKATRCYVCNCDFNAENRKVRDHCHVLGNYRGAACNMCNLAMEMIKTIPVIFHNLKGYDSHLLLPELGKFNKKISIIPINMQTYMSFSVGHKTSYFDAKADKQVDREYMNLRFIDSFGFMASSLNQLVVDLKQSGLDKFRNTSQEFGSDVEVTELMTRKGVYPYSFMDGNDKFDIDPFTLTKSDFRNDLTGEDISDCDYEFYKEICGKFNIKTLGEYHDLYLKSDVLLLSDVFENFRETCYQYYKLDPAHYYSAPGLAWNGCLKMTGIELELISDVDMYLMIEKGLRGGMSVISHRKAEANNKYMHSYDPEKPSKYITYLDANSLYSWSMIQYLPYGGFKWIDPGGFNLDNVKADSDKGHILEVDLSYPKELHDAHNEYPYCCEHTTLVDEVLSPYAREIAEKHGLTSGKSSKLVASLNDKTRYVIHEMNLKQAVDSGLILTKIHRVVEFNQRPWMKDFIDFNINKRKESKNEFEKGFFKIMCNAAYGRTLMNLRKQQNISLINDATKLNDCVKKPDFISSKIFNENLVAVHKIKQKLYMNQPIYVGFSILDLSKYHMYNFHYGFVKNRYGSDSKLLFTDTDSLCYEITTEDFYRDMYDNKEQFDLSDMKLEQFKNVENKKVVGKFKDETQGIPICEFIGLRSKMYSIKLDDDSEKKTAKGIVRNVIKKHLKHENYKQILDSGGRMNSSMKMIRSFDHDIYTVNVTKVSLSAYDDKRYILDDGVTSHAYGHFRIDEQH